MNRIAFTLVALLAACQEAPASRTPEETPKTTEAHSVSVGYGAPDGRQGYSPYDQISLGDEAKEFFQVRIVTDGALFAGITFRLDVTGTKSDGTFVYYEGSDEAKFFDACDLKTFAGDTLSSAKPVVVGEAPYNVPLVTLRLATPVAVSGDSRFWLTCQTKKDDPAGAVSLRLSAYLAEVEITDTAGTAIEASVWGRNPMGVLKHTAATP